MTKGDHAQATLNRYAEAQARLEHAGGYAWRDRATSVLRGLGFVEEDLDRPLRTFSGGELTRASLARALGGDALTHFPWAWKASELAGVRRAAIELDHTRRRQLLRIRDHVTVRIRDRYQGEEAVTCVIPGHDRDGEELVADELRVDDAPLAFEYSGTCGYAATFAYSGG